ncbi:MAG TPA: universal stress protein [Rhodospirillales bacterium]|nr:universal stress protein [Rhodospirillales bacterium]
MAVRTILVPVDGSVAGRVVLKTALEVAREHDAHVDALHVRPDPRVGVPLVGEGMSAGMVEELIDLAEKETAARAREARVLFDQVQAEHGLPITGDPTGSAPSIAYAEVGGREEQEIARRGRVHDLIVLARPSQRPDTDATVIFNAALFETGRPVLVAPVREGPLGRRVAIAWNGSAEAARAVASAMDFIRRAETVEVVSADPDRASDVALNELTDYLAWHGIATRQQALGEAGHAGEAVAKAVAQADLVVMGAYSHSRLRQLILGGVTRYMLEHAPAALLMAH